jgi:hypothetical protein
MVERSIIEELLDEFRFDDVESLIEQGSDDPDPQLRNEIARRRADAEDRARDLVSRVVELGESQRLEEVVELARRPATAPLLALAPDTSRRRAELYLREAERWARRRTEINARRLREARRALDGLDLELARGLMRRIDGRFLSRDQRDERDRLLLDISARAMELQSVAETGRQLLDEKGPHRRNRTERAWWRRWLS